MRDPLRDGIVLITGTSAGIGRAIALRFAREGSNVIIAYNRGREEAWRIAELCQAEGAPSSTVHHLNLMDDDSIHDMVTYIIDRMGHIDILVNNASVIERKKMDEHTFGEIEQQLRVNLEGTIKVTRSVLPHLRDMVINIGSTTALRSTPDLGVYAASKEGILSFTKTLAEEIAPRKAYVVFPRATFTQMTGFRGDPPELVAGVVIRLALGNHSMLNGGDISMEKLPDAGKGLLTTVMR